ncbi:T9SS type A sorting domain-containing protein [Tamlana sp. 2201CG12-4]|uniref:T9SS type A sorting domain-containing protein n=1 Tax=Tamlana sp. 2201CG12-4 TaxID=3112582 RepID=UPI002DB796E3|nr:T9SS type A sorting domain-containing protein [Tamlana sp. 2201CG12-4]MEC3906258.1 T9SS type A sorting domain-containing protein [Tamlana sp. 2201CG12-4]
MKKITLLLFLLTAYLGYAQPTTDPTTPPVRDAGDVISIFCGEYTGVAGSDYNPNWSQSGFGTANTAYDTGSGNLVLAYPNFNYQGVQYGSTQNIAAMEFLHVDIYIGGSFNPNVYVISSGAEIAHPITNTGANTWISVDIAVSGITGDTSSAIQFKFDGGNGTTDAIYVDNLYFWKTPADPAKDATLSDLKVAGTTIQGFGSGTTSYTYELTNGTTTAPSISATTTNAGASAVITQAPGVPGSATVEVTSQDASTMETYTVSFVATLPGSAPNPSTPNGEVLSIYGDTGGFTNIWTPDYSFGAYEKEIDLGSGSVNNAIKMDFSNQGYGQGTNSPVDISAYNWVHFDYYAPNLAAGVNGHEVKFILIGDGQGEKDYVLKTDVSGDGVLTFDAWQSVDIPLSHFTALGLTKDKYLQYKLGTTSDLNTTIVYFDNIYFSVNQGTLGLDDRKIESFSTYPNPTQSIWTVKTQNIKIETISLFDILGKRVLSMTPNTNTVQIDGSNLISGLYFAQVKTESGISSIKLIKK